MASSSSFLLGKRVLIQGSILLDTEAAMLDCCSRLLYNGDKKEVSPSRKSNRWPYHPECARSHLISEAKQGWAWLVLGWEKKHSSRS